MKKTISNCPLCSGELRITEFFCPSCNLKIQGNFPQDRLMLLSKDDLDFVRNFLEVSGNIKEMEKRVGKSYPTVKAMLEKINNKLKAPEGNQELSLEKLEVLDKLESGKIDVKKAVKLLREEI